MRISQNTKDFIFFASFPAVGFAAVFAATRMVSHYGRSYIPSGPHSSLFMGTIGTVNNIASFILALKFETIFKTDKYLDKGTKGMMAAHVVMGVAFVGLSALAAKVNLISFGITLFEGATLTVTGFIGNFLLWKVWS
jgi:hypothetical protein